MLFHLIFLPTWRQAGGQGWGRAAAGTVSVTGVDTWVRQGWQGCKGPCRPAGDIEDRSSP